MQDLILRALARKVLKVEKGGKAQKVLSVEKGGNKARKALSVEKGGKKDQKVLKMEKVRKRANPRDRPRTICRILNLFIFRICRS